MRVPTREPRSQDRPLRAIAYVGPARIRGKAGWEACRLTSWGSDVLANCVILCAACQTPPRPMRVR